MYKVVILGPPGVGKTTFFTKCIRPDTIITPGHVRTERTDIGKISRVVKGHTVEFELVDTVGNAVFADVITAGNIFHNVNIFLCMFNVNLHMSWLEVCKPDRFSNVAGQLVIRRSGIKEVDFIMVGGKSDLESKVAEDEVLEFVDGAKVSVENEDVPIFRLSRKFFRCSAVGNEGIDEILDYIAEQLLGKEKKGKGIIKLDHKPSKRQSCCAGGDKKSKSEEQLYLY